MKKKASILCHTISVQCFSEFTIKIYQYKLYFIRFIILSNNNNNNNNNNNRNNK